VLLGESSRASFVSFATTTVNYHVKTPGLQDEIKIMLPLSLTPQTHLFFTFYQVSCKKVGKKLREVIGYSVLPLYAQHRMLDDDLYRLPIAAKLPDLYLQPFAEGKDRRDIHFRLSGAKCLEVRTRLVSTVFNQDAHLNAFFQSFPEDAKLGAPRVSGAGTGVSDG